MNVKCCECELNSIFLVTVISEISRRRLIESFEMYDRIEFYRAN